MTIGAPPAQPTGWRDGRRVLRIALIAGLLIRAFIFVQTRALGTAIVDEQHYARLASSILHGSGFAMAPGEPTSIRPPLYPGLVAAIWSVAGDQNLQAVRFVQVLLALVTTALVYQLVRRLFTDAVGRLAAAIVWLYPSLIFFNFLILTETLFTLLFVAFVLLTVVLIQSPTRGIALGSGLALGLAALARSVLWPLPIILCPLLALLIRAPLRARILLPGLVLTGYVLAVGPWAIRNTRLQGVVEVVDTMGGINLRMGNYEYTPDDRMWDAVSLTGDKNWVHGIGDAFPDRLPTEGEKDKWAQHTAIAYMRANPGTTLRRSLIKFADFWGLEREFAAGVSQGLFAPPFWVVTLVSALILVAYAGVTVLGAVGIWLTPPERRVHFLTLLPIVAIIGAHTIVFGHSRYHLPLIPILAVYAAGFLCLRRQIDWRRQRLALTGATITVAVLAAIWIRQLALTDFGRIQAFLRGMR